MPIDPREGDRRQKALRARLAALAAKKGKPFGRIGVRPMGARIGAGGMTQKSFAKNGAMNFLQLPGFGKGNGNGPVGAPGLSEMPAPAQAHFVSNPLPSKPLGASQAVGPTGLDMAPTPPPSLYEPVPEWAQEAQAQGQQVMDYGPDWNTQLIPLGGGRYFDPISGTIQGGGGGTAFKAL